MANLQRLSKLLPLNSDDITFNPERPIQVSEDYDQLQIDTTNVENGSVELSSFIPEYQKKIKDNYRFYGHRSGSKDGFIAPRTKDTLDLI